MVNEQEPNNSRKRGAQPGNLNALKHGRFARTVPPFDTQDISKILSSSLEEEISMLRKATRRVFDLAKQADDIDLAIKVLGSLGLAMIRTSRLLKSQQELGDGDQTLEVISAAIHEVLVEWGWR
jgi:hypothetical protein